MAFGIAAKRKKPDHSIYIGGEFHLNMERVVYWRIGQWDENLGLMEPRQSYNVQGHHENQP